MKLPVIILNWNQSEQTRQCVQSIHAWTRLTSEIWIVDNASRPEQKNLLSEETFRSHCIFSETNLGFAGGNNLAIRKLLQENRQYLLLLNNDAEISEENVLQLIASFQADKQLGIVGPLLHERSTDPDLVSAGGRDIAHHRRTRILRSQKNITAGLPANKLAYVEYVPGTIALVKLELFHIVGLLDENYFFSGEMADLCFRMRQHGYRCAVNAAAEARHTSGNAPLRSTLYAYYQLRNRFLFSRKFYRGRLWYLVPFWTGCGFARILQALARHNAARARALLLALADGLSARFGNRNDKFLA